MPRHGPYPIVLTAREQSTLQGIARKNTSPYFHVLRAKAILLAAKGLRNEQLAERLSIPRQMASKWRKRFIVERLEDLENLPWSARANPADGTPLTYSRADAERAEEGKRLIWRQFRLGGHSPARRRRKNFLAG